MVPGGSRTDDLIQAAEEPTWCASVRSPDMVSLQHVDSCMAASVEQ